MLYPILHTGCIPNPSFTIVPVTDSSMLIDNNPVITSFTWKSNSDPSSTGTVFGNSGFTLCNGQKVIIIDPSVSPYYSCPTPSVLSD